MWWKVFDLVPGFVWAIVCALALSTAGANYVRMASAKGELATYRAEVAQSTQKAESEARAKEREMRTQVDRIAENAAKKQTVLAARVAAADIVVGRLRDEITRLNSRPAPSDPATAAIAGEARTARELLGACAERYKAVARDTDELRDQVTGLQDFSITVCHGS